VAGPVGLTWLPTGMTLTDARIGDGTAEVTFTAHGRRAYDLRLSVYSRAGNEWANGTVGLGAPDVVVARYPAWYEQDEDDNSQVLIEDGSCGLRLQISDRNRLPLSVLDRIVAGAAIGSCDGVENWPPILS